MKASRLDPHRDFILKRLQSKISISQIRLDLITRGCPISRSALTEWIDETAAAEGIELPPRKRGRPINPKRGPFSFLPPEGADSQVAPVPLFLFALQKMPKHTARSYRDFVLTNLGLPLRSIPASTENGVLEQLANLSDTELCLLALLRSDLPEPPLTQEREELISWFTELMKCACNFRAEIRAATNRMSDDTSLKESPCA